MNKVKPKKPNEELPIPDDGNDKWIDFFLNLKDIVAAFVKTLGVGGFFAACIFGFIIKYATIEQKQAIIDRYLLFNIDDPYILYGTIIIVVLVILLIMQKIHTDRKVALLQKQVDFFDNQVFKK